MNKKVVKFAWVFDVDGVITNIEREVITEPLILDSIIKILEKGQPVALNTGRGIDWVEKTVLNPLKIKTSNLQIFNSLFIVAESGGITTTFNQDGSSDIKIDPSLKMPSDLDQKVRELVQTKYSKSMRYEDKKTMITTKIKEGYSVDEYQKSQREIAKDLQNLIHSYGLENKFKVALTTIGTDIMHNNAGKDKGIELILNWLLKRGIKPQKFITFGDSESDVPMAQKLHKEGKNVELVYVGNNPLKKDYPFPIKQTEEKFEKGTLEFLKSL